MTRLFFLVEHNLSLLQPILRKLGHSAFLPFDTEIGIPADASDSTIIAHTAQQKEDLGIDRIIITRDKKFITYIGTTPIKILILSDKTERYALYEMKLKELASAIISNAMELVGKTQGQAVGYLECSCFY